VRAAFLTIGQSPRDDIVDEMRPWWERAGRLTVEQHGALDGLDPGALARLLPAEGEERLVSRLRDGTEVVLPSGFVHERVHELVSRLEGVGFDFLVLLCTGPFPGLSPKKLLVAAQPVVDHAAAALLRESAMLGILVPHEAQMASARSGSGTSATLVSHASPYSGDRWDEAARELSAADVIVLHCMGYTEAMRARMAEATGKPILLARRLVAAAVAQLVSF
jgi:protein AroM